MRILVVHPQAETRRRLTDLARARGHSVQEAEDDTEALIRLNQEPLPDVVLAADESASLPLLVGLPIVLTGSADAASAAVRALRAGAVDYLPLDGLTTDRMESVLHEALQRGAQHEPLYDDFWRLAQHSSEVVVICAPDGEVLYASPSSQHLLGHTPVELRQMSLLDFFQPEHVAHVENSLSASGTSYRLEHELRHKSGAVVWMESVIETIQDTDGGVSRLLVTLRDITPRKRLEQRLHENQTRLRIINNIALKIISNLTLPEIIRFTLHQIHSQFPHLNLAYLTIDSDNRLSLLHRIRLDNQPHPEMLPPDLTPVPAYVNALRTGSPVVVDDMAHDSRFGTAWQEQETSGALLDVPFQHAPGVTGVLSLHSPVPLRWSAHDITLLGEVAQYLSLAAHEARAREERDAATEALRINQERFQAAIKNSPVVVFNQDRDLRYTWIYNPALGMTVEEVIGKTDFDLFANPDDAEAVTAIKREVLRTGTGQRREIPIHSAGEEHWFDLTVEPLRDTSGEVIGVTCATTDVTQRKRMEHEALQAAIERERVRVIAGFVQDASHEFRTPLSIINSSLYLMSRAPDPEQRRYHALKGQEQVQRIAHLLEDLVQMARLDSNPLLDLFPVDVNEVARLAYNRLQDDLAGNHVSGRLALTEALPTVMADSHELQVAIAKLLENAVRYTPAGGFVTVSTGIDDGMVYVGVDDNGPGMDDMVQSRMFERFYRQDEARGTPGFGLGLPIARRIVELHGGRIDVESSLGQGTRLKICLPLHRN